MLFFLIYLAGYICSYILLKKIKFPEFPNKSEMKYYKRDWDAIGLSLLVSALSWFAILVFIVLIFLHKITDKDPPKWL